MELINKEVAKKLFDTLDDETKEEICWANKGEGPQYDEPLSFNDFYDYLTATLSSNTMWDIKIDVVSACYEMDGANNGY